MPELLVVLAEEGMLGVQVPLPTWLWLYMCMPFVVRGCECPAALLVCDAPPPAKFRIMWAVWATI